MAATAMLQLNKQSLSKQPVPDLKDTANRYLRSLKPLLRESEYKTTQKIVLEFIKEDGIGSKLHEKLLQKFDRTNNWMSDWWLDTAYLGYRAPVIVNSNPGTVGPQTDVKSLDDVFAFAAQLIRAVVAYDHLVKSCRIKQEMVGNIPLDMQPYTIILGSHRRPKEGCDQLMHTDETNHVIIISNNHFFKLPVANLSGPLSQDKLARSIKDIVKRSSVEAKPVGILTGNDRDTWAQDYNLLLELGNNQSIIQDIESSMFILCLDKNIPRTAYKGKNIESLRAVQCLTGFSSCTNAGNRWHDKTVQFIISPDGFVGMEYEHSPCEAVPVAVLFDYVLKYITSEKCNRKCCKSNDFPRAERLKFKINNVLGDAIKIASRTVDQLSEEIDMECFKFNEFGTSDIKRINLSPDSFIQIAMQVTFYKLHGKPAVHYETATLRRFENARTECIRSTSSESVIFAMAFDNLSISNAKKKSAMTDAIHMHKELANKAVMGEGVDRHLYGLKMIAKSEGIELPELYKDIGYKKKCPTYNRPQSLCIPRQSNSFKVCDRCFEGETIDHRLNLVPYKTASFMCYGPAVPEGYGCCYNPRPTDIIIACSSFKSCRDTDSKKFVNILKDVLHEMKELYSK